MLHNKRYKKEDKMPPIPKISKEMILESSIGRVSALDEGFAAELDAFMNEKHDYYVLGE